MGDTLDCWRIELIQPGQRLRLAAEMKLPGRAWLEFEVQPDGNGALLRQMATLDPFGLWGWLIGMACGRCTKSCSPGCCAALRVPPAKSYEYSFT
jgi:hypothetical protein